ncbi:MAG: hypothetical protein KTR31_22650, partial [Myxococcales bacterium]|nr:hypothetical protein [Myxococcales bacterium]
MSRRLDQMTATSLGRARERLARVAWLFGGGLVMLSVFEGLLFIALFGTERWELSLYTQDAD